MKTRRHINNLIIRLEGICIISYWLRPISQTPITFVTKTNKYWKHVLLIVVSPSINIRSTFNTFNGTGQGDFSKLDTISLSRPGQERCHRFSVPAHANHKQIYRFDPKALSNAFGKSAYVLKVIG